jgi:chitinase
MLSTLVLPLVALSAVSASPFTAHSIAARSIFTHSNTARSIAARSTAPVAAAWFAGWHATDGFPLSSISWEKYNTLYYSFA